MNKKLIFRIILLLILFIAAIVRFYKLGEVPYGLNNDEASMGYNAYSLLKTGKDRFGEFLPVLFRSLGSFQPPVYTYFSIIPIKIFGLTFFAVHFTSAVSGVGVVILTFLIVNLLTSNRNLSLITALLISISPWSVFFSRVATEANVGLFIFLLGYYLFFASIKRNRNIFPISCLFLGLSTHAYYSERVIVIFLLPVLLFIYRKLFINNKKWLITGIVILFITQVPHIYISQTGAFVRRLDQVSYLGKDFFDLNGGKFKKMPFGRSIFILREFGSQYFAYFSPKNLFFESDEQGARSMPDISVFYKWMIIPFVLGISALSKRKFTKLEIPIVSLLLIAPIPAALTFDPFYTLRVLVLLWGLLIIISLGVYEFLEFKMDKRLKYAVLMLLSVSTVFSLFRSLFILDKYERADIGGYSYIKLIEVIDKYEGINFVIDSPRDLGTGIRMAFLKRLSPSVLQEHLRGKMKFNYYSSEEVSENYPFENIEIRQIIWEEDVYKKQILVGDELTFSEKQIQEHFLKPEFEIRGMTGKVVLRGFSTDPKSKCEAKTIVVPQCKGFKI